MSEGSRKNQKSPRRRVRKTGTLADLKRIVWQALNEADLVLRRSEDRAEILRAVSAISTASGVYARLLADERQAELDALRIADLAEFEEILDDTVKAIVSATKGSPEIFKAITRGLENVWTIREGTV